MRNLALAIFGLVLQACSSGGHPAPPAPLPQEPARNPSWGLDRNDNPRSLLLPTGEYVLRHTEMVVRGRRLGFRFTRVWRSQNPRATALGRGWDANVFTRLEFLPGGTIRHHEGTGRFDDYVNGVAPPGRYRVLRAEGDGTFTLRYRDGLKCTFDAQGRITRMRDRFGNECTYMYDGQGRLGTFLDDLAREYSFGYDAAGRLTTITDFTGRVCTYAYDAAGRLTDATSPAVVGTPNGNDFPNGKTERYGYDASRRIASITYPNEVADGSLTPGQTMTYDARDRVVRTTVGGTNATGVAAGGELRYAYDDANRLTTVTDRNGNTTVYAFDLAGHTTSVTEEGAGGPFVTRFEYDTNGEMTRFTRPEGNSVEWVYDDANADVFQRGNRLSERRIADARGGDQTELQWSWTYEPLYNRPLTETSPRGNDPTYVPQNGGAQSAARYTASWTYDYQEAAAPPAEAADFGIVIPAALLGLGDVNGDGATDQAVGNVVRRDRPTVTLLPGSNQAAAEGSAFQAIVDRYTYNGFGQLTAREDARGNTDTLAYFPAQDPDGDGQDLIPGNDPVTGGYLREWVTDALAGPRRQDAAEPAQISESYTRDPRGNPVTRTDGRGFVHRATFNALDQVVQTEAPKVDPAQATGHLRRYFYDANDNLVRQQVENVTTDPDTHGQTAGGQFFEHRWSYDILDNLVQRDLDATRDPALATAQPERLVTEYRYDPNENLLRVTKPEGNADAFAYDERDLRVADVRGAGAAEESIWTRGYDLNRNLVRITDAVDGDVHAYAYDGFDRRVRSIDRDGNEMRYAYDPEGNVVRYDCLGRIDGAATVNVPLAGHDSLYDELNRRFRVDRDLFVPAPQVAGFTVGDGALTPGDGKVSTAHEYDANSRLAFLVRDDLATYATTFDGVDRPVRIDLPLDGTFVVNEYDDNHNLTGRVETHASPEGLQPDAILETLWTYDERNRRVRATDPKGQTTYFEYDSRNNLVSRYDARGAPIADPLGLFGGDINDRGNPTRFLYDGASRLWSTVRELRVGGEGAGALDTTGAFNPDGLVTTRTEHDGNSRVAARVDDNGNRTEYGYDDLDRLVRRTNAEGGVRTWTWDADHRVTGLTDENGTVHTCAYDALDRLRSRTMVPDPSRVLAGAGLPLLVKTTLQTFEYDGRSRLTRCVDNNDPGDATDDAVVVWAYDSLDRRVEEVQDGLAVGSSYVADDRTACHYPDGRAVSYGYDGHNQVTSVSDAVLDVQKRYLGACPATILETWSRPGFGTVAERQQTLDAKKLVQQIDYLDPNGQGLGTIGLGRNRVDDVNAANITLAVPGGPPPFVQTQMSALDSRARVTQQNHGQPADIVGINEITDVEYGGAQDPRRVTMQPGNQVQDIDRNAVHERTDFVFDGGGPGNGLRTDDGVFVYQWDALDRLRTVRMAADPDTIIAEYDYDASPAIAGGRRVRKTAAGQETRYYYDGMHVIEERDGADAVVRQFIWGLQQPDDILAMEIDTGGDGDPDALFVHLKDWNNNVTHLVDANGQPVEFYAYDFLGAPTVRDGNLAPQPGSQFGNPFLFTGRRLDPETGLYYYRARHYDPVAGEFLSRDPLGFWGDPAGDGNPFAYAGNNPWNRRNPSGMTVDITAGLTDNPDPVPGNQLSYAEEVDRSVARAPALSLFGDLDQEVCDLPYDNCDAAIDDSPHCDSEGPEIVIVPAGGARGEPSGCPKDGRAAAPKRHSERGSLENYDPNENEDYRRETDRMRGKDDFDEEFPGMDSFDLDTAPVPADRIATQPGRFSRGFTPYRGLVPVLLPGAMGGVSPPPENGGPPAEQGRRSKLSLLDLLEFHVHVKENEEKLRQQIERRIEAEPPDTAR